MMSPKVISIHVRASYLLQVTHTYAYTYQYIHILFILAVPSAPELSSHNCMNIMSSSLILQWNPPSDDGGKSIHYNVIGTPDDISFITDNTMMAIPNLTPNTEYKFVVRAINSVGFGDELYIQCTTLGNGSYIHTQFTSNVVLLTFPHSS